MEKVLVCASTAAHLHNFHLGYLRRFCEAGWEVHTASSGIPDTEYAKKSWDIGFKKSIFSIFNILAALQLKGIFKRERYSLILVHTSLAAAFCRLAFSRAACPGTRLIYVCHGYFFNADESGELVKGIKNLFYLWCERLLSRRTDQLFLMNERDLKSARRYKLCRDIRFLNGMGLMPERYSIADEALVKSLRSLWRADEDTTVYLSVGEFSPRKNQMGLLRAYSELYKENSNVRLIFLGSGETKERCQLYVKEHGLRDTVHFMGQVPDVSEYFLASDVLVSVSFSEGLPFNILEALYFSLPVVATKIKGHTDLIENFLNGLLFSVGDINGLCEAMRLLTAAPFRKRLKSQSRLPKQYLFYNTERELFSAIGEIGVVVPLPEEIPDGEHSNKMDIKAGV